MSTPLASFFTKIGFEVDKSSLNSLDKQLGVLEKRIASMAKSFQGITNNPAIRAAASLAKAEANKLTAEANILRERSRLATIEAKNLGLASKVDIANAAVQKVIARTGLEKEKSSSYYAKANSLEMIKRMQVGSAADMAAIKESFASGQKLRKKQEEDEKLGRNLILMRRRNELNESASRRRLIQDQSKNNRIQVAGAIAVQKAQAQTQRLVQQAITKSTPYAQRMSSAGGRGGGKPSGGAHDPLFTTGNLKTALQFEGARRVTQRAYNVGNFQLAQPLQYEFITGSAEAGAKEVAFLNKEVDRLSLNLMDASQQYKQLLATTYDQLGSEQTQKLFSGAQNLATMLGLSTDAQNRMFRAFGQMGSKSAVMAEELKGQ